MRKLMGMFFCLFLSGCHLNDPRPKVYPAQVHSISNNICILVPSADGEYLSGIEINDGDDKSNSMRKRFLSPGHSMAELLPSKCVPTFDYKFNPGHGYGVSIGAINPEMKRIGKEPFSKTYIVYFSVLESESIDSKGNQVRSLSVQ